MVDHREGLLHGAEEGGSAPEEADHPDQDQEALLLLEMMDRLERPRHGLRGKQGEQGAVERRSLALSRVAVDGP